jgi:opacity protein-like surface antigen
VSRPLASLGFLVALLTPAVASAEWLIAPFAGIRFGADTTYIDPERGTEKKKFVWGGSVALLSSGLLGVEADFGYIPGFFEGEDQNSTIAHSRAITLMGNVILAAPLAVSREGLRPYLVGGIGLVHAKAEDAPVGFYSARVNVVGLNIGGGAIGPLTPHTSVRFEVRHFRSLGRDPAVPVLNAATNLELSFWRATLGVAFRY